MNSFLSIIRISFLSEAVYKLNRFFAILGSFIGMAVPLVVWIALYSSYNTGVVAGRTISDMVVYVLISRLCVSIIKSDFAENIEKKMKSGAIGHDFIRPQPPRLIFIAQSLGNSLNSLIATLIPFLILVVIFYKDFSATFSPIHFIFFLMSIVLGFIISVLFEIMKGTLAFWFVNVWFFNWFLDLFYVFLSGAFVPLWFFPGWLQTVARLLPFQAAYFLPVEIYLGRQSLIGVLSSLFVQLIWIFILFFLQELMWRKGVKKIVVLGG